MKNYSNFISLSRTCEKCANCAYTRVVRQLKTTFYIKQTNKKYGQF